MPLSTLISHWRAEPGVAGNIAAWRTIPARPARLAPFPPELHPGLCAALDARGIGALYSHQSLAWKRVQDGENTVIVTGTASGKTLAYNLPILDRLFRNRDARALYLFPAKALAQDQLDNLRNLIATAERSGPVRALSSPPSDLAAAVYDGDTPAHARPAIRGKSRLVLSNPDMLHAGILPHHTQWAAFFENLHFVVIDEMHAYRGVFGSHVANVLRRLKRIARSYGSHPQFILTSATIGNPLELAQGLIEAPAELIDQDGAARGPKHFLIYNPPVVDRDLGLRRSALLESVRLAGDLLDYDAQTIVFGRARRTVEIILTYLRQNSRPLTRTPHAPDSRGQQKVRGYRGGYLPRQRREIELGLRRGDVRAVVATNALELGIDIGGMAATVLAGYPGTIAATWQQVGRAGRAGEVSLAVLVATASPLDQFLAHHPDYLFARTPELGLINPDNLLILLEHLKCAAFELPFQAGEAFGDVAPERVSEFLEFLAGSGLLHFSGNKYFWMSDRYPAAGVSLRTASVERVLLQIPQDEIWTTIGEIDLESAHRLVHPGAIYMHEANTYLVGELDLEDKIARMDPVEVDYYTEPRAETTVSLIGVSDQKDSMGKSGQSSTVAYGEILVTGQVTGFRKIKLFTHEVLGLGALSLPPMQLNTTGYWVALSEGTVESLRARGLWTNDPNRYGPNWQVQKERARARDGYRCQICDTPEEGRAHDVHHKIPFRTFSSFEQSHIVDRHILDPNSLPNLITLCPVCHRRAEAAVRMRSGLAGVAYALGNLAPIYLMCDTRDLGVHSDPQSALSHGSPAVVLYDQIPAGIGFSQRLFELHDDLILAACELVQACECTEGCPSCVGPAGENGAGGKREALALLEALQPGSA